MRARPVLLIAKKFHTPAALAFVTLHKRQKPQKGLKVSFIGPDGVHPLIKGNTRLTFLFVKKKLDLSIN
jgi:hypothetical protein